MSILTNVSESLRKKITDITSNPVDSIYDIKVVFTSTENREFVYTLPYFERLDIVQNFLDHICDVIVLEARLSIPDYFALMEVVTGLECTIEIRTVNKASLEISSPILLKHYVAIIKDKRNLSKEYPEGLLRPTESAPEVEDHISNYVTIEFELIEHHIYYMRKRGVNFIAKDEVTMDDVLLLVAKLFDMKKVYIVPSDNHTKYQNVIIPPLKTLSNVISYLQNHDAYGIYEFGASYYYTNDVFYVYPMFDTEPTTTQSINIYNVGEGTLAGLDSYHRVNGDILEIISNRGAKDTEMIYEGLENIGNRVLVQPIANIVDKWREVTEEGFSVNKESIITEDLNVPVGVRNDVFSPSYLGTDNIFRIKSILSQSYVTLINLGWAHAVPFSFKPGMRLNYFYDHSGEKSLPGITNSVIYGLVPFNHAGTKRYTCTATMSIMVQSD